MRLRFLRRVFEDRTKWLVLGFEATTRVVEVLKVLKQFFLWKMSGRVTEYWEFRNIIVGEVSSWEPKEEKNRFLGELSKVERSSFGFEVW